MIGHSADASPGRKLIRFMAGIGFAAFAVHSAAGTAQTTQITPGSPIAESDTVPPTANPAVQDGTEDQRQSADIIVTGTLIRGVAPTGSNVIGLSRQDIVASGATSGSDLLSRVPQITNQFNQLPYSGAALGNSANKPILRNLGTSSGSTTLVLLDGRRLVGNGGGVFDPTLLPPAIIERLEIVPDGGSSLYGSDAIGGVINFITRRRTDGVEMQANVGGADDYKSANVSILGGKSWSTGSLLLTGSYAYHTNLSSLDRDYVNSNNAPFGGVDRRLTTCAPGNITAGGVSYALPGRTPGVNLCDDLKLVDLFPAERRESIFGSLTQELADGLEFATTAFYAHRKTSVFGLTDSRVSGNGVTGTITSTNPYFRPIGNETSQTVSFSTAPITGFSRRSTSTNGTWQVMPSLRYAISGDWEVKAEGSYGEAHTLIHAADQNSVAIASALAGTTLATALNPYDPASSDAAVIRSIEDYQNQYDTNQSITNARLIANGTVISLPGGEVKIAAGAEYYRETIGNVTSAGTRSAPTPLVRVNASRNIKSLYGELNVPIVGADNGFTLVRSLIVNGSIRYDDYNDVGGTTNGKIALDYRPVDSLRLRANWGTSFHAPALADSNGASDTRAQVLPVSPWVAPGATAADFGRATVLLAGGNPNLRPETAKTWSAGGEYSPTFAGGLKLSATYWNVKFKDAIVVTPFYTATFFTNPVFNGLYIINPTQAQAQSFLAGLRLDGISQISDLYTNGRSPYALLAAQRANFGKVNINGIDYNASYNRSTGFGSVSASFGGTYILNRESQTVPGTPFIDDLDNGTASLNFAGTLGAQVGKLTGRGSWNYSGSYPVIDGVGDLRVKAFQTIDLFASYEVGPSVSFNVTARNIFDTDPAYQRQGIVYSNGGTLGRYIQVGFTAKF